MAQNSYNLGLPAIMCFALYENISPEYLTASDNDHLIIPHSNGRISAVDIRTGHKIWQSELGGKIVASPLIDDFEKKTVYAAAKATKKNVGIDSEPESFTLRSISVLTGLTNWRIAIDSADKYFLYNFKDKIIYAGIDGSLACVRKIDGSLVWKTSLRDSLSAEPFFDGETLTVAHAGKIISVAAANAEILFQADIDSTATSLLYSGGKLFWGDAKGAVYSYVRQKENKKRFARLWRIQTGGAISAVVFTSRGLLATSFDNFVYLFSPGRGKLVWKKRFAGRIIIKPVVSGELAAVTSVGSADLSVLDLRNGKIVNRFFLINDNSALNSPLLSQNFLILPALNGIYVFKNREESKNCGGVAINNGAGEMMK